jgi:arylsulfatase A-like enzyme
MMALGTAVEKPGVIERPVRHVDLCPTVAGLLGCPRMELQGMPISEFRV